MIFQPGAPRHQTLEALLHWQQAGEPAALIVITAIEGRTSREVGTIMAITVDGKVSGSISGGCFDAAVIAEAQAALRDGKPRWLKLGAGSSWIDIQLPCGGGIELLIVPNPDGLAKVVEAIARRTPNTLALDKGDSATFALTIQPRLRLLVAGNGGEVPALVRLARDIDAEVLAISSEKALLDALDPGTESLFLHTAESLDAISFDPWTAVAIFFHDHDWEPPLLHRALTSEAFFVGAMGSIAAHAARRDALISRGVREADIARIKSPIGLFGPMRDPQALAVSALAQIVAEYHRK
jgi:xanthine dehydrogenase accessory factor